MKNFRNLSLVLVTAASSAYAMPQGFHALSGDASCSFTDASTLEVVAGDQAVLQWDSFSIDAHETTRFVMPSSTASVLNRVMGGEVSEILGKLESNGQVFLINPKGILVGDGAMINTSSFIASSFDFLDGKFLEDELAGSVINLGTITATDGAVRLIGGDVRHEGMIRALETQVRDGRTYLVGGTVDLLGNAISLTNGAEIDVSADFGGGSVHIGGGFQGARLDVQNASFVLADESVVVSADALLSGNGGQIIVWADGQNSFSGFISAQGGTQNGDGGFVEVSSLNELAYHGLTNTLAPNGIIGTLLLDPPNVVINAADAVTLSNNLNMTSQIVTATKTITLTQDAVVNWMAPTALTLSSGTDLFVYGTIRTSAGAIILDAGENIFIHGGDEMGASVNIQGISINLSAVGNVNIIGGQGALAFATLQSALDIIIGTSMTPIGGSLYVTGGSGQAALAGIGSKFGSIQINVNDDFLLIGSDLGSDSFATVAVLETGGTLSASAGRNIVLAGGSQFDSGAVLFNNSGNPTTLSAVGTISLSAGVPLSPATDAGPATITTDGDLVMNAQDIFVTSSANAEAYILSAASLQMTAMDGITLIGKPMQPFSVIAQADFLSIDSSYLTLDQRATVIFSGDAMSTFAINTDNDVRILNNSALLNQGTGASDFEITGSLFIEGGPLGQSSIQSQGFLMLEADGNFLMQGGSTTNSALISAQGGLALICDEATLNPFSSIYITGNAPMSSITSSGNVVLIGSTIQNNGTGAFTVDVKEHLTLLGNQFSPASIYGGDAATTITARTLFLSGSTPINPGQIQLNSGALDISTVTLMMMGINSNITNFGQTMADSVTVSVGTGTTANLTFAPQSSISAEGGNETVTASGMIIGCHQ